MKRVSELTFYLEFSETFLKDSEETIIYLWSLPIVSFLQSFSTEIPNNLGAPDSDFPF